MLKIKKKYLEIHQNINSNYRQLFTVILILKTIVKPR